MTDWTAIAGDVAAASRRFRGDTCADEDEGRASGSIADRFEEPLRLVTHFARDLRGPVPVGNESGGAPCPRCPLHNGEEHPEGHRATVPRRPAHGARTPERRNALLRFLDQLGELRLLDPACGCGNFLIIAYRELRLLEMEIIREIEGLAFSRIDVDQFYGIELGEFPVRIAETALWMMDHIMNNRLSLELGEAYVRIPLEKSPRIVHADALETDWTEVLAPEQCSFVLGNPPFAGAKYQSPEQRAQVRAIAALGKSGGNLDYVAAWFIKAGAYVRETQGARIGFVATNSITQGEQVAQLWPSTGPPAAPRRVKLREDAIVRTNLPITPIIGVATQPSEGYPS